MDELLRPTLVLYPCYTGSAGDTAQLHSLRSAPGLIYDGVRTHHIAQQHVFNPPCGEDRNYWKSSFVRELPDELIDELVGRMVAMGRPPGQILFESLHGAPKSRFDPDNVLRRNQNIPSRQSKPRRARPGPARTPAAPARSSTLRAGSSRLVLTPRGFLGRRPF